MKNKEKKVKEKMNGSANSNYSKEDEFIATEVLLSLSLRRRHMPLLEYLNDSESNWKRKRRRSCLDPIPLPLQPPPVVAEKDATTSPNTPFNFQTSDEELMMHSSPTKKRARRRMDVEIGSTPLIAEKTQAVGPIMAHSKNGPVSVGPIGFNLNELPDDEEDEEGGESLDVIGDRGTICEARNGVVV